MKTVKHPTLAATHEVDDQALADWLAAGWLEGGGDDLASMTLPQLRDLAAERGVDLAGAAKKADVLAALRAGE